jgi:hypothetical protein
MIGTIVLLSLSKISDKHDRRTRNLLKKKGVDKAEKDICIKMLVYSFHSNITFKEFNSEPNRCDLWSFCTFLRESSEAKLTTFTSSCTTKCNSGRMLCDAAAPV